jgi:hypothetical protein
MRAQLVGLLLVMVLAQSLVYCAPVLSPLSEEAARGPNRVANPSFEEKQDGKPVAWQNASDPDWALDEQVAHTGKASVRMSKPTTDKLYWISQPVELNQTRATPLVVSAWSKADKAEGSRGAEYSVWVDLQYMDGTPLYGQRATFEVGTHDWQKAEYSFVVSKPVKSATVHLLFRRGFSGTVWFDDVSLQELQVTSGLIFDRIPASLPSKAVVPGKPAASLASGDGLALSFDDRGRPSTLTVQGKPLLGKSPGGFWLRDVAAAGPWLRPDLKVKKTAGKLQMAGQEKAAGLALNAEWASTADGLDAHVTVRDLTGKDRAVTAYFVLPVADLPWQWHDDVLHSLPTSGGEYANTAGWPLGGLASAYPWCSITAPQTGLSLSAPMDCPRVARFTYNSDLKALFVAVSLGIVKDTANFPSQADFRFSLYWHDPAWGFRAASAKYYQRHPQFFVRRLQRGGIWNAFGPIQKMKDWQDFGFAYDENSETPLQFDNDNDIASFRYIEPMTYWLPMAKSYPRTNDGAMQALQDNLEKGNASQKQWAQVTRCSGVYNHEQKLDLSVQNQAWCDGAVFTLNPDPFLAETPQCPLNKGHLGYNKEWADKNLRQKTGPRVDGIYLDSMPNWGDVRNWRREHWKTVTVPLTFDPESKEPMLLQVFSTWQYSDWIARDVHERGGFMHGNGGVLWPYFPALLDVTGQETGAILTPEAMATARTLMRTKPYSPLLNTRFANLPPTYSEDYFHACVLWDIFPSYFCGDYFQDGQWKISRFFDEPQLYEKVRPLYKQFIPILRRMYDLGWEPVTYARTQTPGVMIERYGPGPGGETLLAVYNSTKAPVEATVTVDAAALKLPQTMKASALVSAKDVALIANGKNLTVSVSLAPARCEVIRIGN